MRPLFLVFLFGWMSLSSIAQQNDTSIYTIHKSRDFTKNFSLEWEYSSALKEMLPTKYDKNIVNWQQVLPRLEENPTRYKSFALPQKEVLSSCALMLVLLDKEEDSKFYQTKNKHLQLLQERLNSDEKEYLKSCLSYLEQQNSPLEIIKLWQVFFHYTTDGNEALYAAEKLLSKIQNTPELGIDTQEDLVATTYYLIGAIYADRGDYTYKKKYYNLCYELRKKRGDDLCYSLNRVLKNTSPGFERRKALSKDLMNSIQEHGCRNDKKVFQESMAYLLSNKAYDSALELFEQVNLKNSCFQDLEELSYGTYCPYLYLGMEALSKGNTFDDPAQDRIAMHWFKKWIHVLDSLSLENAANTADHIKLEEQYYLNYTDHACTRIIDYMLYYGKYELAKDFFEAHQKPLYLTPNTNPNIIYNFNSFYYKFIPHHAVVLKDDLVLLNLKEYLNLSYEVIKGEEKARIEPTDQATKRGRECIAWLGQKTTNTASYLQYLEYWMSRAKDLNYISEEILAHRYYCAALRKDQQYLKALEFALKFNKLAQKGGKASTKEYALRVRSYFLDNVVNHYEINSKERKQAIILVKNNSYKKNKKWSRIALKQLKKQAPYKPYQG